MDLIIRLFVWVSNYFTSGKALAWGYVLLGTIISFVIFKLIPVCLNVTYFIYPSFELYISEHMMVANLIFVFASMAPISIGYYIAIQQLNFIYYKESSRGF